MYYGINCLLNVPFRILSAKISSSKRRRSGSASQQRCNIYNAFGPWCAREAEVRLDRIWRPPNSRRKLCFIAIHNATKRAIYCTFYLIRLHRQQFNLKSAAKCTFYCFYNY